MLSTGQALCMVVCGEATCGSVCAICEVAEEVYGGLWAWRVVQRRLQSIGLLMTTSTIMISEMSACENVIDWDQVHMDQNELSVCQRSLANPTRILCSTVTARLTSGGTTSWPASKILTALQPHSHNSDSDLHGHESF